MKRWIHASISSSKVTASSTSSSIESKMAKRFSMPSSIAKIVLGWYKAEDALEDFTDEETDEIDVDAFLDYVESDIWDMLDAADEGMKEKVGKYFS